MHRSLNQLLWGGLVALVAAVPAFARLQTSGFSLRVLAEPQCSGPCLASLVAPPSAQGHCIQWNADGNAAPTMEAARQILFVGTPGYLKVLDARTARLFAAIKTEGSVTTKTIWSADGTRVYFATDKGVVSGLDAFSFAKIFDFQADGTINNDLMLHEGSLIFSTGLATVYSIDSSGKEQWRVERPLSSNRLVLTSLSNIIPFKEGLGSGESASLLAVPHPEGFVSILSAAKGSQDMRTIRLEGNAPQASFRDIVAPMLYVENLLWVASFDRGIFVIDPENGNVRNRIEMTGVSQLALDEKFIYGATSDELFALSHSGDMVWRTVFADLKTKEARYGFPFAGLRQSAKRVFMGVPSRLLVRDNKIVMATSRGAMGEFSTRGTLLRVVGNSLGFSPKIGTWEEQGIAASTRRGFLALFR